MVDGWTDNSLPEKFIEAVGEELASIILEAYAELDDEGKETLLEMIQNEQWDDIIEVFTEIVDVEPQE